MKRRGSTSRFGFLVAGLVLVLAFGAAPASGGEGWWGGLDDGEAVSLADVIRGPREYRNRIITFFCVFHTADGAYKYYPPHTAFSEQRHVNFSAWPDGAPVWTENTFKNGELVFLYLRRTNSQRLELLRLPVFTRVEVTGKIRDIVRGKPAIEVFSFRTTGHRLGKPVVRDIMDGIAYARTGTRQGYQLAARAFKEALQPDLPPVYDMQVRKLLADALRKLGHDDEARAYENGESVGMPELPKPDPDKDAPQPPFPDDMPQPFNPTPDAPPQRPGADNPLARSPVGSPDGDPPAGAPPTEGPPTGALPPAPLGPDEAPSGMPPPAPSYGSPDGEAQPKKPKKKGARTPPSRPKSAIPPKRRPRLTGVK